MTFRALAGGGQACAYCGFCLVMEGPRQCCPGGRDYDVLAARLAEAERDSRRLQWLADNPRGAQIVVDGKTQDCVFWGISAHPRAALRDAIDAAMGTTSREDASHE